MVFHTDWMLDDSEEPPQKSLPELPLDVRDTILSFAFYRCEAEKMAHDFRPAIKYLGMFKSNELWNTFTEGSKYIEISKDRKTARRTDPNEDRPHCTVVAGAWVPWSGRATGTVKLLSEGRVHISIFTNECQSCNGTGQVPGRVWGTNPCEACNGTGKRQLDYNTSDYSRTAYRSWTYSSTLNAGGFESMEYCENGSIFSRTTGRTVNGITIGGTRAFSQGDTVTLTLDNRQLFFYINGELRDTINLQGNMPPVGWDSDTYHHSDHVSLPLGPATEVTLAVSMELDERVSLE